jgi:CheY-like chemotaxis protein
MSQTQQNSILFAHDDLTFLMYISILVKRFGYDIYLARNGADAVRLAKANRPSVIVLDQDIPQMDADTCLSMIRGDAELKDTPVLLMISEESEAPLSPVGNPNYCGYLKKPLNISDFYSAVQRCHQYAAKRRYFRTPMLFKVCVDYGAETRELFATNLSVEGMFLRAMKPYNIGAELDLVFSIDDEDPVEMKAMVVSAKSFSPEMKSEPGMGLKFLNLPEDVKYRISYALMKEISKDLLPEGMEPAAGNYLDDSFV